MVGYLPAAPDLKCDCGSIEFGRCDRDHKPECLTNTEVWVIHAPEDHLVRSYYPPPMVQRFTARDALAAFLSAHGSAYRVGEVIHVETKLGGNWVVYQLGEHGPQYYLEFGPHWRRRNNRRSA